MGRPRKTEDTSTTQSVEVVNESATEGQDIEMTHVALGMAKNKQTGLWHVVRVPYNFEQQVSGAPEASKEGEIRAIVMERFKIMASQDVLSNE